MKNYQKRVVVTVLIILIVAIIAVAVRGIFKETNITVVDSHGQRIAGASVWTKYGCRGTGLFSDAPDLWTRTNDVVETDHNGAAVIPGYYSVNLKSLIPGECYKQILAFKDGYAAYKNMCNDARSRIGTAWTVYDTMDNCGAKTYRTSFQTNVTLRIDKINDAPDYGGGAVGMQ